MVLSERFEAALVYAAHIHAGQVREGTEVPCLAHLLGVASIVLDHGGSEDEAIAALLHDAAETAGGRARLDDIQKRFGEVVADIVEACTDSFEVPKPPWRARKASYIARIPHLSENVRLISTADQLYNARSLLLDLRQSGDAVWKRLHGGKESALWYYRCLVRAFRTTKADPLLDELDAIVKEIERFAAMPKQAELVAAVAGR